MSSGSTGSPESPGSSASPYTASGIGSGAGGGGGGSNGEAVVTSGTNTKAVSTYVVGSSSTTGTPAQFTGGANKHNAGIGMLGAAILGAFAF